MGEHPRDRPPLAFVDAFPVRYHIECPPFLCLGNGGILLYVRGIPQLIVVSGWEVDLSFEILKSNISFQRNGAFVVK